MTAVLEIISIIIIIGDLFFAIISGSSGSAILVIAGGITLSAVCFSLAKILKNQEIIKAQLRTISEHTKKPVENQTCSKCGAEYEVNLSSCPECGYRNNP